MWESIKKDPLLKTIVVIILGIFAFGLAFNIMFGTTSTGMEDGAMMSSGYSFTNTLEIIIGLLIKFVIIAFLIGLLVWLLQAIKKQTGIQETQKNSWIMEDSVIRNTLIFTGMVFLFGFVLYLIKTGFSFFGYTGMMGGYYSMGGYTGLSFGFINSAAFLLKILVLILVVFLAAGLIMYTKDTVLESGREKDGTVEPDSNNKKICPECKGVLNSSWSYCPKCGRGQTSQETENSNNEVTP